MLKEILDTRPDLSKHLYEKGYLITNSDNFDLAKYPFYNNWRAERISKYYFFLHHSTSFYTTEIKHGVAFLIGHAYNPFTLEIDEKAILSKLFSLHGQETFFDYLNELTGVFVLGLVRENRIEIVLDASGMQCGYYGFINGQVYITSHMRMVGDICNLQTDEFVKRLTNYKWYKFMLGNYLPGDISCYKEIKRIIPNTYLTIDKQTTHLYRFYPSKEIQMCASPEEYETVINDAAKILKNTMSIIPQKWNRAAISLTGGIDSNTTFAAANGNYDKFETFSYVAMYRESVDSEMAKKISEKFAVKHKEYIIPEDNETIEDFEIYKKIFIQNGGNIGTVKDNDTRKKIVLIKSNVCDVEVKSWISETIRAYAYKYFGRKKFPKKLTPRNYTSLYKIFLLNRSLVWEADKKFEEYLQKTCLKDHLYNYDESDFFVWEMMHGGKCGLDIGVMKSCFDIDIPYNNRKLLDILLKVPLEDRISDKHHLDLKRLMNKELFDMNIRVVNLNETKRRKAIINWYYKINSFLPF